MDFFTQGVCNVVLLNEVACRIDGLTPINRTKVMQAVTLIDPKAKYTPQGRLGRWDGSVVFMKMGGQTYINLLPLVLTKMSELGIKVTMEDQRTKHNFQLPAIDETLFSYVKFPAGHTLEGQPILLRPHQVRAVNAALEKQRGVINAATGAGKTLITAALSKSVERYGRSIVIVPSTDLVTQTEDDYKLVGLDVGVFYGTRKEFGHKHTICTWQSLGYLWNKTKREELGVSDKDFHEFLDGVVCVMGDEAHTSAGDVLRDILEVAMGHIPLRWGLTGTIPKDKIAEMKVRCNFGTCIVKITAKELQTLGVLSNCHVNVVKMMSSLKFKTYHEENAYLTTDPTRMSYIAKMLTKISESGNTLILVNNIATGKALLKELGLPKEHFVSGSTKKSSRKEAYSTFNDVDNAIYIATYGVASTGISISRIFNLVLFEAGKSFTRTIQSVGRGLRVAKDKDYVNIYDICGSNKFSARHLSERKMFYDECEYPYNEVKIKEADWNKSA